MADAGKLGFGPIAAPAVGVLIVFADENLQFGPRTRSALGAATDLVARAAKAEHFTGKSGSALDILAPVGLKATRLIVIGTGKAAERKPQELARRTEEINTRQAEIYKMVQPGMHHFELKAAP